MAKGNMFQGMARGKVGDVVFSRNNGEQISRVRNRHPQNPRTNKQMLQRAVMATVMQAYSAGREIFDHSFQGKSVGAACQRAFLSRNSKLLRGNLSTEIEAATAALLCNVAVVAPGANNPTPNEYMVSEGSYPQNFFSWVEATKSFQMPEPAEGNTVAEYASMYGLVPGDIYTFVGFVLSDSNPSFTVRGVTTNTQAAIKPESQYPCTFAFLRLQVKDVSGVTTDATAANLSTLFDITATKNTSSDMLDLTLEDVITPEVLGFVNISVPASKNLLAYGVIRSRFDMDLRSTSFMHVAIKPADRTANGMYGITSPYALLAWQQGTESLGDPEVVLEGGDEDDFHRA